MTFFFSASFISIKCFWKNTSQKEASALLRGSMAPASPAAAPFKKLLRFMLSSLFFPVIFFISAPLFLYLMSDGLTGGGKGLIGLNRGSCGQWQWTHNLYCFSPFHIPVRFPCSPAFQSRSIVPWHWPQRMYDSSKLTNLPFASLNLS